MAVARARPAPPRWLQEAGDLVGFAGRSVLGAARAGRYAAAILRQCALLIAGSALVLVALVMVVGGECGLFVSYLLRPLGATAQAGPVGYICGIREMFPYMFAYIFAAKVGCGLVAEIGAMRISDEIDALESVAIDPMRYLVGPRLLAVVICVPLIYVIALVAGMVGGYVVNVFQFGDISSGQYLTGYWSAQNLHDNLFSLIKAGTMAITIALVALYYGYRARGGPVGVGDAVARSMIVNLVLIHVIGATWSAVFWGTSWGLPYGG